MTARAPAPDAPAAPVVCSVTDGVGEVLLNRPRALNTVNAEVVTRVSEQLIGWRTDDRVREVVLRGTGDRAFCAGADVKAVRELVLAGQTTQAGDFWAGEYALVDLIGGYPKPVTAIMHGYTMGAGLGLAAFASRRLIRPGTQLAMPETKIGFFTDAGISRLFARCPGELGTYLALTGAGFGVADALALGFADDLATDDPATDDPATDDPAVGDLDTGKLAPGGPSAGGPGGPEIGLGDRAGETADAIRSRRVGEPKLPIERRWIDEGFAGDDAGAIIDRLAGNPDPRARECAALLRTRPPLSLRATLARVRAAAHEPDLTTTLAADTALARRLTAGPDFLEGVRTVLIDKGATPTWAPAGT